MCLSRRLGVWEVYHATQVAMQDDQLLEIEKQALMESNSLAAQGRRRTHAELPAFRLQGPHLFVAAEKVFRVNTFYKTPRG